MESKRTTTSVSQPLGIGNEEWAETPKPGGLPACTMVSQHVIGISVGTASEGIFAVRANLAPTWQLQSPGSLCYEA